MLSLEERLQQRFPQWFSGRRAALTRPLLRTLGRWSRFETIEHFLAESGHLRDFAFVDAALDHVQARYTVDSGEGHIPERGRLLIVANHPSGATDALALLQHVGTVRRDVRIIANDLLMMLEPLSGLLLPVRILDGRAGAESLRAVEQALRQEQCVIVFPAGEVSRLGLRGVRDGRWQRGFVRFARKTGAPVLPVRIKARNSALFYGASALFKPAGTALLAREMYARRNRPLSLRIGQPLKIEPDADPVTALRTVRKALYALGKQRMSQTPGPEPLAPPEPVELLRAEIAATELLGETQDGKQIRLARLRTDSPLLREIGRAREFTFRKVGEGTGRSRDIDAYDAHYEQIVLWDADAERIAGGYRVMRGSRALADRGLSGLYTASLFRYSDDLIPHIAEGMELGRSYVTPEYWGSRSLDYLWYGLGAYLMRYPGVRYLFGPVSISAALPLPAREQLVAYYQRYYGCQEPLVASLKPFQYFAAPPSFGEMDADTAFGVLKGNLSALGASVPMLYKQYTDLCEPGGARFLAFGVDPDFSDSIDGLIEVDMHKLRPNKRKRYLKQAGADA
ncbi:lysophospholipid acyltransferase family protein [Luteimonas panaciterrae]|uniref:lysophospholipid acyltransferase family protein n=1 Tax=Luteimonas panaciterrae TaxID=363885 RepID=UPI001CFAD15F|nr:lysophospholipid acyltransferase family protein [Luteimonas panaciterrae]